MLWASGGKATLIRSIGSIRNMAFGGRTKVQLNFPTIQTPKLTQDVLPQSRNRNLLA
jgi:hypothetical protein